jgi:hypothetical protein
MAVGRLSEAHAHVGTPRHARSSNLDDDHDGTGVAMPLL